MALDKEQGCIIYLEPNLMKIPGILFLLLDVVLCRFQCTLVVRELLLSNEHLLLYERILISVFISSQTFLVTCLFSVVCLLLVSHVVLQRYIAGVIMNTANPLSLSSC